MKRPFFAITAIGLIVGAFVFTKPVLAASINITDDDVSGVVITNANFEFGFNTTQLGFKDVSFDGSYSRVGPPAGSGIIYFVEPETGALRDIFEINWIPSGAGPAIIRVLGRFESDVGGVLTSGRTVPVNFLPFVIEEVAGPQDVVSLFRDPASADLVTIPSNLTISVLNDLNPIPEPSTMLLLGFGLAGLGFFRLFSRSSNLVARSGLPTEPS